MKETSLPNDPQNAKKPIRTKKFVSDIVCPPPIEPGKSIADKYPKLVREWDLKENRWTAEQFMAGSGLHAFWICSDDPRHLWSAVILSRTRGGNGCPYCSGKKVLPEDSLKIKYPKIAEDYDRSESNLIPSDEVPTQAGFHASFKCDNEAHALYRRRIADAVARKGGCPQCSKSLPSAEYNFKTEEPGLVASWSPNNPRPPEDYLPSSREKLRWKCTVDTEHPEWEATVAARREQVHCPRCWKERRSAARHNGSVALGRTLDKTNPYLAKQHRGGDPKNICPGSHKLEMWECGCTALYPKSPHVRIQQGVDVCRECGKGRQRSRMEVALFCELKTFFPEAVNGMEIGECSIDITIPSIKLVIEYDGAYYHGPREKEDRDKSAKLISAGWAVLRVREVKLPLLSMSQVHEISWDCPPRKLQELLPPLVGEVCDFILARLPADDEGREWLVAEVAAYKAAGKMRAEEQFYEMARRTGLPPPGTSLAELCPDHAKLLVTSDPRLAARLHHKSHKKVLARCWRCNIPRLIAVSKLVSGQSCSKCGPEITSEKRWGRTKVSEGPDLFDFSAAWNAVPAEVNV